MIHIFARSNSDLTGKLPELPVNEELKEELKHDNLGVSTFENDTFPFRSESN